MNDDLVHLAVISTCIRTARGIVLCGLFPARPRLRLAALKIGAQRIAQPLFAGLAVTLSGLSPVFRPIRHSPVLAFMHAKVQKTRAPPAFPGRHFSDFPPCAPDQLCLNAPHGAVVAQW
ncbi:hypothetical protein [Paracoccus sp. (in: a-proteobacteria)]|uniref:hypothetical protein n=1 Tax=Paracoccus sp. TaxID=267 RepID=UPI003A84BF61